MSQAHTISISSLLTAFTDLPPSCVQFAPEDPSVLVIGTYYLDASQDKEMEDDAEAVKICETSRQKSKLQQKKYGSLHLYKLTKNSSNSAERLELIQTLPTDSAVFDIRFHGNTLAVALSSGDIDLYTLHLSSNALLAFTNRISSVVDSGASSLYLAFHPTDPSLLASTYSTGEIALISKPLTRCSSSNGAAGKGKADEPIIIPPRLGIQTEVWVVAFSPDGMAIYSGDDSGTLRGLDLGTRAEMWYNRKHHGAGVTSILPWQDNRNMVLTGSYDEYLRVFDLRTNKPVHQVQLDGGVWRLERMGATDRVVASCMHAGTRVVDIDFRGPTPETIIHAKFEEHESMNYGSSFHSQDLNTVVSCSFYDKRLCIWNIE